MKEKVLIYGAGDNGVRLAEDIRLGLRLRDYEFGGFIDDHSSSGSINNQRVIGDFNELKDLYKHGMRNLVVTLFKDPIYRLDKIRKLQKIGFNFPSIYDASKLPRNIDIGKGVIIHEDSTFIGYYHKIRDFSLVGPNAVVEGRTTIGEGTMIRPFAFVGYNTQIGEASDISVRATVFPNLHLFGRNFVGPHTLQRKNMKLGERNLRRR